jgi:hypothetical protein
MVTLVETVQPEQVGGRAGSGSRAFALPRDGRNVVRQGGNGALPTVEVLTKDVLMANGTSQFQVRVGDASGRVFVGDQLVSDFLGELGAPEDGIEVRVGRSGEPDASHACGGGIDGSESCRHIGDNFGQVRRAATEISC